MPSVAKNTAKSIGMPYELLVCSRSFHATVNSPPGVGWPAVPTDTATGPYDGLPACCSQASFAVRSTHATADAAQCRIGCADAAGAAATASGSGAQLGVITIGCACRYGSLRPGPAQPVAPTRSSATAIAHQRAIRPDVATAVTSSVL